MNLILKAAKVRGASLAAGLLLALSGPAALAQPAAATLPISGGQGLAQRHCGGCHAVGAGKSPLADAPPFASLYLRYPRGGLDQILTEGMLTPRRMPEEGTPERHPRMPMVALDDDQVAQLKAYLQSLDPRTAGHAR
ncbi:c-type cytochrome [Caulobacter henricii]|uniref:Cytochrome C n=1 Tax=Caulobacter henricii TaxID=69395 RepID=A0A0P0NWD5_9CAUL|nr:cytochrome c [Caulobacter henricii]ALL12323.1 cytochrome C [Caulobacter henricii]